jgi:hypothetical protein
MENVQIAWALVIWIRILRKWNARLVMEMVRRHVVLVVAQGRLRKRQIRTRTNSQGSLGPTVFSQLTPGLG